MKGQVIGIIEAKLDEKNVTYTCAITLSDVNKVLNRIKFGEPFKHKDLGIKVQEVNESSNSSGLVVTETYVDGPAYMDLFPKDVILEMNNHSIASISDLRHDMLMDSDLQVWTLKVNRDGKFITICINM